ncbi:MAG: S41 family peptidase [Bilifractor sp.]|jgi:carboxyl-terminal processing protease
MADNNMNHSNRRLFLHRFLEKIRRNWKPFLAGVLVTVLSGVVFFSIYLNLGPLSSPSRPSSLSAYRKARQIQSIIRRYYLNDIDEQSETDTMYLGLVTGLGDKYSTYYTAEQYKKIKMSNDGQMEGIGITISKSEDDKALKIESVLEDSPAEKAGLAEGDRITMLNGKSTEDMTSSDAVSLIQNSDSDQVTMTVVPASGGDSREVTLTKETLTRSVVTGSMLDDSIGYIQITSFNRLTSEQFQDAYDSLNQKGMKGLIIDLRDNLGGLVSACCDTLRVFMPKGPLVYEQDRNGDERQRDNDTDHHTDLPVVLLVNGNTASASEMFAGAVLDYNVGIAVGTVTYGKGIEQDSYTLSDGSVLKITTTHYYTPNHNDVNGSGITPNITVEADKDETADSQLEKATAVMKEEISGKTVEQIIKENDGTGSNYKNTDTDLEDAKDVSSVSDTSNENVSDTSSRP